VNGGVKISVKQPRKSVNYEGTSAQYTRFKEGTRTQGTRFKKDASKQETLIKDGKNHFKRENQHQIPTVLE
jgi:hypothetical protein